MNQVILMGRLTRDPEMRYTQTQTAVVSFTIAVDKGLSKEQKQQAQAKGQPTADFFRCTAFKTTADLISKYSGQGCRVIVNGRLSQRQWQDKNGNNRETYEVNVFNVNFIDFKESNQSAFSNQLQDDYSNFGFENFEPINDDSIPF